MLALVARHRTALAAVCTASLAATLSGGCYRAVPLASADAVPEQRRVVVTLSDRGARALAPRLGEGVVLAEGVVAGRRPDTLDLLLLRTEDARGVGQPWQRQAVSLPSALIARVAERRLDRGRSALLAGALVGLAVGAFAVGGAMGGGGGADRGGSVVPPN